METIEYKGFTINIDYDSGTPNPLEEYDTEPSVIVRGWDYFNEGFLPYLVFDKSEIRKNLDFFKSLLGYPTLLQGLSMWGNRDYYNDVSEQINDILMYQKDDLSLSTLADLYRLKGCKVYHFNYCGYSQGEYLEGLVVASKFWANKVGANLENITDRSLNCTSDLLAYWYLGDVFYYCIEDSNGDFIDSCGGFYGSNHKASGLLEYAENAIDCHIRHNNNKKRQKLAALIKAKVPLDKRADILAAIR